MKVKDLTALLKDLRVEDRDVVVEYGETRTLMLFGRVSSEDEKRVGSHEAG